jgi:preprotein translocase subunit SecE
MDKVKELAAKVKQFLREVRVELRKVTWPSFKGAMASTSVVIVVVVIVSIFLGVVDFGLTRLIRLILG